MGAAVGSPYIVCLSHAGKNEGRTLRVVSKRRSARSIDIFCLLK